MRMLKIIPYFLLILLVGCSGSGYALQEYPENGFDRTLNYQFQAKVFNDQEGECKRIVVEVKALNKVYMRSAPPERLRLYDDDCLLPLRFEQIKYLSTDKGGLVQMSGIDINYFWSENYKLQNELMDWLWQSGIVS